MIRREPLIMTQVNAIVLANSDRQSVGKQERINTSSKQSGRGYLINRKKQV